MKDYKRLTERDEFGNADIIGLSTEKLYSELCFSETHLLTKALNKLAELEDKIESGEIVDRNAYLDYLMSTKNVSEVTDKEIEFFAKHNARVREYVDSEIARLTAENAALQKRLDNTVELPRLEISPYDSNVYYLENGHIQQECFNNKHLEQVQKRFAELKGGRE